MCFCVCVFVEVCVKVWARERVCVCVCVFVYLSDCVFVSNASALQMPVSLPQPDLFAVFAHHIHLIVSPRPLYWDVSCVKLQEPFISFNILTQSPSIS